MPTPKLVKKLTKVRYSRNGSKIIIGVGDFVNVVSDNDVPYVARITEIGATAKGDAHATMQWMYRTQDLGSKPSSSVKKNEIFYATHSDVNPMESVIEQVKVQFTDAKGNTYLAPVFNEKQGAKYPMYICSMEYQPEGNGLVKLSSERLAEIKAGSILAPQSTSPLQLASSSSKSDGPGAGKLSPIKHAKLVSRIASHQQEETARQGESMVEKEAAGSPRKGSVSKEQTSAQSRSVKDDLVKPISLPEDEVVREQATEPVKSPTKEARIRKSQSALNDQERAEVNSPKAETNLLGGGMADTIGTTTTATAKTARPLANVKRRLVIDDDIEDDLPKEKAAEQVEVEKPTATSASKKKKSRILEDAEDDDRTETASPTSASKLSVDRSADAKDASDVMSEVESEKSSSVNLETGNGSGSRVGKSEPIGNATGATAVAMESSTHDGSKSQMKKSLQADSGQLLDAVAKTVGHGENGQQTTVDTASPLRDGPEEKKDVQADFVSKGSSTVVKSNEATGSSLESHEPKQGIKQPRGEKAILTTKAQSQDNVEAVDKTNLLVSEGANESSKKVEAEPNERNVLRVEGSVGGEQISLDSKQQSSLKLLSDELSPQSTIQKDLSDQSKTAPAAATVPTAPSLVVLSTTPPMEETERSTNESSSEGDMDESFKKTSAAAQMLHEASSQRLSVTVNDSQSSPQILPSSPAARNLPVSPRPTRTRIGPAYQAVIPAYLGPGPLAPTSQDRLVWSPSGASEEKKGHEIDLEAYQLLKDRLRRRGSVVPVAILEPGAQAASDRKRVFWARIHETIATTDVNKTIKVIPVESTWPETPGDLASFKMKPGDNERAFEVPKTAVFVPENLTERCLLRDYRRRLGGASSSSSSTDQGNDLSSFTQEELQWTQGVAEMYERWSRKDYDEFAMALRNVKDRSLLRNVYKEMTSPSKAITLTDVVNMFSMSSRTGVSTAIAGMVTCSSCKTIQTSVISCVRYHDCRIAVCHSCFTNAKPFSKYIESDGDNNQPKSFEALKYSHWFCRYCLRKMAKKDLKHGLPPPSSSTTPPPPPTSGFESSAAGAAAKESTESTSHHASSYDQSSSAAAGFRNPSTAAAALRIRATLSSSSSSPSPSSSSPHSFMTTVPDVLLEYDEGRLSAEEALNQIRQLMLAEASKALRLKRPRLSDPDTSRSQTK